MATIYLHGEGAGRGTAARKPPRLARTWTWAETYHVARCGVLDKLRLLPNRCDAAYTVCTTARPGVWFCEERQRHRVAFWGTLRPFTASSRLTNASATIGLIVPTTANTPLWLTANEPTLTLTVTPTLLTLTRNVNFSPFLHKNTPFTTGIERTANE